MGAPEASTGTQAQIRSRSLGCTGSFRRGPHLAGQGPPADPQTLSLRRHWTRDTAEGSSRSGGSKTWKLRQTPVTSGSASTTRLVRGRPSADDDDVARVEIVDGQPLCAIG